MDAIDRKLERLRRILVSLGNFGVAFSGGIDSSLLLKVAAEASECRVVALMAVSDIQPRFEMEWAERIAEQTGAPLIKVGVPILDDIAFTDNPRKRCYICKKVIFKKLSDTARQESLDFLVDGTNWNDLSEDRPGNMAIQELGIRSPLAEAGVTKAEVREMARRFGMETADRPENTCLATRIPYGQKITPERLQRIEGAEDFIRSLGIDELRVRDHDGLARIEVPSDQMDVLIDNASAIKVKLKELGFGFVTLDLEGFRSGSLD